MDETYAKDSARSPASSESTPSVAELQAKLFRGLADPNRLALLRLLVRGPSAAGDLARQAGLSPSGASNHLRCLLECGLVTVESHGRFNRYSLADVGVAGLLLGSEQVLARVGSEIEACLNYGPPSRRALRQGHAAGSSSRTAHVPGGSSSATERRARRFTPEAARR